jgi:formylglycine-generating enzyme
MKHTKLLLSITSSILCLLALTFLFFWRAKPTTFQNMVIVEGGTFMMGDTFGGGTSDQKPVHQVKVNSFAIGKYEVTQKEWKEIMGTNPCYFKGDDQLPVEEVNWYDCIEFCNKKSLRDGLKPVYIFDKTKKDPENTYPEDLVQWLIEIDPTANGYRLPTEAEWEYAARGGKKSKGYKFSGSNQVAEVAWCTENSGNQTHPVGTKRPNELGLHDMSGNVWEWCWDWADRYPGNQDQNDYYGKRGRILRGGSYGGFQEDDDRPSTRNADDADSWEAFFGFRLCRSTR